MAEGGEAKREKREERKLRDVTEMRGATEERKLVEVQPNHRISMFIETHGPRLTKGAQTCQMGEAAGLLECV